MALGDRGYGLICYAQSLYDDGHRPIFLRHAHVGLRAALSSDPNNIYGLDPWARDAFTEKLSRLESTLEPEFLSQGTQMKEYPQEIPRTRSRTVGGACAIVFSSIRLTTWDRTPLLPMTCCQRLPLS